MVRTCEDCGKVYDDFDHRTYCPHEWFQMNTLVVRADGQEKYCHSLQEWDEFLAGHD